jgi:hypothetical protein
VIGEDLGIQSKGLQDDLGEARINPTVNLSYERGDDDPGATASRRNNIACSGVGRQSGAISNKDLARSGRRRARRIAGAQLVNGGDSAAAGFDSSCRRQIFAEPSRSTAYLLHHPMDLQQANDRKASGA